MKKTSPGVQVFRGIPVHIPNHTMAPEDGSFHVSYNASGLGWYGDVTTALVGRVKVEGVPGDGLMEAFYILNGDHRKAYEKLIPEGWDACLAYYESLPDQHNKRTDTEGSLTALAAALYANKAPVSD